MEKQSQTLFYQPSYIIPALRRHLDRSHRGVRVETENPLRAELIQMADAASLVPQWQKLGEEAIEPNPYYCPAFLIASAKHINDGLTCQIVAIWKREQTGDLERELVGLFPIAVKNWRHGYPIPVVQLWRDCLTGVNTPLMASEDPSNVWRTFLQFIKQHPKLPDILHGREIYSQDACCHALMALEESKEATYYTAASFERAIAQPISSNEEYINRWSAKRRRNIRASTRKLEELGEVSFETVTPSDAHYSEVLNALLELEKAGWKGREGTAFNCQQNSAAFVQEAFGGEVCTLTALSEISIMRIDGRIVAGLMNLVAHGKVFGVRSAYDEKLANQGPGTVMYAWLLERMLEQGDYKELDSCADAGHLLEKFWLERKQVSSVYATADTANGTAQIERILAAHNRMKQLRDTARNVLARVRGKE